MNKMKNIKQKIIEVLEDKKGCGKEACGVHVTDRFGEDDIDIIPCGCICPYHKEVHYCPDCRRKEAIRFLNDFINTYSEGEMRQILHDSLSCLENGKEKMVNLYNQKGGKNDE